ncbi:cysteine-rich KTR domain-containing protein [Streptococcus agalactiae]
MMKCEWILCPVCGSKTRNKIRKDTVLENYPLYCPKCRQEKTMVRITRVRALRHRNPSSRIM